MKKAVKATPGRARKPRQGTLVIVGGHEDKDGDCAILNEVVRLVKGGNLVVSTVASEEPDSYFGVYDEVFKRLGLKHITEFYVNDRAQSSDEAKLKMMKKAAGVYFTGGDQLRICSQIGDTPFETEVRRIYEAGGVVAGTSAGASAIGETMLVKGGGGESCKVGDLHLAPGLGLLRNTIIDQHFAERGRFGRLLAAIALNPRILGIGIDEDTAIVVQGDSFTVIGTGAIYVVDGTGVTHSNIAEASPESIVTIFDVKIHILSAGDRFDLVARRPLVGK